MRLWVRVSIANAVALLVALGLTAFLGYDKFASALVSLEREEAAAVVVNVRDTIEAATSLGLPLKEFADAQAVLDRNIAFDPKLSGLVIFDLAGAVLFSSFVDGERLRAEPPADWRALTAKLAGEETWSAEVEGRFSVGAPLTAPSGALLGGVMGLEHTHERDEILVAMAHRLTIAAVLLYLAATAVAAVLIRRICPR